MWKCAMMRKSCCGCQRKWPQRVRKWKLQWRLLTESHSQLLCEEESNQHWARRCKIWSGTTSSKNRFSLQLKTSSSWYWNKSCGQGAWPWSRTSSPQKCPSSCRWCQLFWALSVGHEGRPTWAAVSSQWIHNCWQQLLSRHVMCPQVHYLFGQPQW